MSEPPSLPDMTGLGSSGTQGSGAQETADDATSVLPTGADSAGTSATGDSSTTEEAGCDDPETWFPDDDEDGFGDGSRPVQACDAPAGHVQNGDDCDDRAQTAHPGADELCDGIDNDCDTKVDEWSNRNEEECNGCEPRRVGTIVYYTCPGAMTWHEGQDLCRQRGAELTSIESMAENDTVRFILEVAGDYDYAFIGYNDIDTEGMFVWSDGSLSNFEMWGDLQPDMLGDGQDCVAIHRSTGEWFDFPCRNSASQSDGVVCRDPQP